MERMFALTTLIVEKENYAALRKFFEDVRAADQVSVTFEKSENAP